MSMQFGSALQRILQRIAYANPRFGPVNMLKFDISDGYYRVRLSPEAALEMAVIIPGDTPSHNLVAIPLSLPMGWALSPPYFCAYTETAADLSNSALACPEVDNFVTLPPHPVEVQSQQPATPVPQLLHHATSYVGPPGALLQNPIQYTDVYMDDFIALAQQPCLRRVLHHTLKGILSVFRDDPHKDDPATRRHIISTSKMAKGEAAWSTRKVILGWLLDSAAGTLQLQPHKAQRLGELLAEFQQKRRTSRKKWQSLLGELRYMATALQGTRYLFSVLQHVLCDQPTAARLRLSPLVHQTLADWASIANTLSTHPMPITSVIPHAPAYVGAVDASGIGCGGFWVETQFGYLPQPIAFRCQFPLDLQNQLVSASNPKGTITNSDFELAAMALGVATLQQHAPTKHACIYAASDNTPAVAWCAKGSTSSVGANAHLLRWLAQLSRDPGITIKPVSVSGESNKIADFCSRSFHLQDKAFLQALNDKFPTPASWKLVHPTAEHVQSMTSALSRRMCPWRSAAPAREDSAPPLMYGNPFVHLSALTLPYHPTQTPSQQYSCSPIATALAPLLPEALKSAVKRWATPFVPWARRSPAWVCPTQG